MKNKIPKNAEQRKLAKPVVCYKVENLPKFDKNFYETARSDLTKTHEVLLNPRDADSFQAPTGHFLEFHVLKRLASWRLKHIEY